MKVQDQEHEDEDTYCSSETLLVQDESKEYQKIHEGTSIKENLQNVIGDLFKTYKDEADAKLEKIFEDKCKKETDELKENFQQKLQLLTQQHESEKKEITEKLQKERDEMNEQLQIERDKMNKQLQSGLELLSTKRQTQEEEMNEKLEKERTYMKKELQESTALIKTELEEELQVFIQQQESDDESSDDEESQRPRDKKRSVVLMGFNSLNADTYTLMMISDGHLHRDWLLGFAVFLSQLCLGILTLYSQVKTTDSAFNNSFLRIPIHTKPEVTFLQMFSIFIAVYSQDDVFNAIALPIDLRLNGPHPWGGIPIEDAEKDSRKIWVMKILLPNLFKCVQGLVVLAASVIVILQSIDVIELLKDFTALYVISLFDDIIFSVARRGFFGTKILQNAAQAEETEIRPTPYLESESGRVSQQNRSGYNHGNRIKTIILNTILALSFLSWLSVVIRQKDGKIAAEKYPNCEDAEPSFKDKWILLDNNNCDVLFNHPECAYDGGDCVEFNQIYPGCKAKYPEKLANGICDGYPYNSYECRFDGGDCRIDAIYCDSSNRGTLGDGVCDEDLNNWGCYFDRGDCFTRPKDLNMILGNGDCDENVYRGFEYSHYDGGDCIHPRYEGCHFINMFPDFINEIGDGKCDNTPWHNTKECNWDGGDCITFNEKYRTCRTNQTKYNFDVRLGTNPTSAWKIGDGECDSIFNTSACGYDEGDCCYGSVKDGRCDEKYDTIECYWDQGDCIEFREEYPKCDTEYPSIIGNNVCDEPNNREVCGFDGGDCNFTNSFPNCNVSAPLISLLGDGSCDNKQPYNTKECGFDKGDCDLYNSLQDCIVPVASLLGDGVCHDYPYNTKECGFDGGDCT